MSSANGSRAIEEFLHEHGVTEFVFKERLALRTIDRRASFNNQARLYGAINDDHVIILAVGMEETPKEMDPIIVYKDKILAGNHRYKAATDLLEWKTIAAYVITQELTETQERVIAYTENLRNKARMIDLDEREHHAAWLTENRSMTQRDAAQLMKIPEQRLRHKLNRDRAINRVDKLGLRKERERIKANSSIDRIGSIRDDEVLTAAIKLVSEAKLGTEDTNQLVAQINRATTVAAQLALIEKAAESVKPDTRETAGGKVPTPKVLMNIRSIVGRIERVDLVELREVKADPDTKKRLRVQAMEASARLTEIAQSL